MLLAALLLSVAPWEGKITVATTPADAEVLVDGDTCAQPCELGDPSPGRHVIRVRQEGFEERIVEIDTALNERKFVNVVLFPLQTDPAKNLAFAKGVRTTGWVLLGTSLATMATAGILQLTLNTRLSERAEQWQLGSDSLADRARSLTATNDAARAQAATIGVAVAGGAMLVGAVAMLAFGPDPKKLEAKLSVEGVTFMPIVGPSMGLALGF